MNGEEWMGWGGVDVKKNGVLGLAWWLIYTGRSMRC